MDSFISYVFIILIMYPYVTPVNGHELTCFENTMLVTGMDIRLSDAFNLTCEFEPEKVQIVALHKIFIDVGYRRKEPYKNFTMSMISSTWVVEKLVTFDLSGGIGKPLETTQAAEGVIGIPGNPGYSGGNFLGFFLEVERSYLLTIISNGGSGGNGQDGGNGRNGKNGEHGYLPDVGITCSILDDCLKIDRPGPTNIHRFCGDSGSRGEDGCDGGGGGSGGYRGKIDLFNFGLRNDVIRTYAEDGADGIDGSGGWGGYGGWNGRYIQAECDWGEWLKEDRIDQTRAGRQQSGTKGKNGWNKSNLKPTAQTILHFPFHFLNSFIQLYWKYFDTVLPGSVQEMRFIRAVISFRVSIFDYLDRLLILESISGNLTKINTERFFAEALNSLQNVDFVDIEHTKMKLMILASMSSKLLNKPCENDFVIDVSKFIENCLSNTHAFNSLVSSRNTLRVIKKEQKNYKLDYEARIAEASKMTGRLSEEIDTVLTQINSNIRALVKEVELLKQKALKNKKELEKNRAKLDNALLCQYIFGGIKIFGSAAAMCGGPIGTGIGVSMNIVAYGGEMAAAVKYGTTKAITLPVGFTAKIESIDTYVKTVESQRVAKLSASLTDIQRTLRGVEGFEGTSEEIKAIETELEKNKDSRKVGTLKQKMKKVLAEKGKNLEAEKKNTSSYDKKKKVLKITGDVAQLGSEGTQLFNAIKAKQGDKADNENDIEKAKRNIAEIDAFEDSIYDKLMPEIKNANKNLRNMEHNLQGQGQISILFSKWELGKVLKHMKFLLIRATADYKINEQMKKTIELLDDTLTTISNIYDRLDTYKDQKRFADLLTSINAARITHNTFSDIRLNEKFIEVELSIQRNLILSEQTRAVSAFKQWVFPFAEKFITDPNVNQAVNNTLSIIDLIELSSQRIESLASKFSVYHSTIAEHDQYLHYNDFVSNFRSTEPFYVWNNTQSLAAITNLLSGKVVEFYADRKSSKKYNAVKFREIEINFKSNNMTSELNYILKDFKISMTHLGNSYYRYNNKYYVMNSQSAKFEYTFERNEDKSRISYNQVYNKVWHGDFLLSPYAMWRLKLLDINDVGYKRLLKFAPTIDVELVGKGTYADNDFEMNVDKHYTPDKSLEIAPPLQIEDHYFLKETTTIAYTTPAPTTVAYITPTRPPTRSSSSAPTRLSTSLVFNATNNNCQDNFYKKIDPTAELNTEADNVQSRNLIDSSNASNNTHHHNVVFVSYYFILSFLTIIAYITLLTSIYYWVEKRRQGSYTVTH